MSHNWLHTPDCKLQNENGEASLLVGHKLELVVNGM